MKHSFVGILAVMAAVTLPGGAAGQDRGAVPSLKRHPAAVERDSTGVLLSKTNEDGQPTKLPALPAGMTLDLVRRGDDLFHGKGNCFACHGADAEGMPNAGSALTLGLNFIPVEWRDIDSLIVAGIPESITRSAIVMPPRGGKSDLTDQETRAVAAYIWAISQVRGEPWPAGHPTHESPAPKQVTPVRP